MKKTLLGVICIGLSMASVEAQTVNDENVPVAVKDAFKTHFSIAEKVKWELEYDNYEADFAVGKSEFSAVFDREGKWMLTETYMKAGELPKPVKETLTKEFGESKTYAIEDVSKQEMPDNIVKYEMDVKKGELVYEVVVSDAGELQKKLEKKVGEKED